MKFIRDEQDGVMVGRRKQLSKDLAMFVRFGQFFIFKKNKSVKVHWFSLKTLVRTNC